MAPLAPCYFCFKAVYLIIFYIRQTSYCRMKVRLNSVAAAFPFPDESCDTPAATFTVTTP